MLTEALLLFLLVIGLLALAILVAYIWVKDPFKTALGSCLSSLAVLVGSLSMPALSGTFDVNVSFGFINIRSQDAQLTTGTPTGLWATAFISIVLLTALFSVLLFFNTRAPATALRDGGGLGGPVF